MDVMASDILKKNNRTKKLIFFAGTFGEDASNILLATKNYFIH